MTSSELFSPSALEAIHQLLKLLLRGPQFSRHLIQLLLVTFRAKRGDHQEKHYSDRNRAYDLENGESSRSLSNRGYTGRLRAKHVRETVKKEIKEAVVPQTFKAAGTDAIQGKERDGEQKSDEEQ